MPSFFPRHTIDVHLEEPAAFRRLSFSLVEMALVTGVVLRLGRVLLHASSGWPFVAFFVLGTFLLLGMATAHLANFPIRQWAWRAPAFALLEAAGEMAASAALIGLAREPLGSAGRAHWGDWPGMATATLGWRLAMVAVWSLLLAGVVTLVRRAMARRRRH
ncbi:MAG TPA: hypothetical protein VEA99_14435 [Gemmatimonadaceae bacterium]|nr:hypothetical protein [Gemmatimonadaceae bacterium]